MKKKKKKVYYNNWPASPSQTWWIFGHNILEHEFKRFIFSTIGEKILCQDDHSTVKSKKTNNLHKILLIILTGGEKAEYGGVTFGGLRHNKCNHDCEEA